MAVAKSEILAYLVSKEDCDIRKFPSPENTILPLGSITLGDLHGNTLKLLHFLFTHGVIRFNKTVRIPSDAYQKLVDAYEAITKLALQNDADDNTKRVLVFHCKNFLQNLEAIEVCSPKARVRLIGDELADRGGCDYLTLKVFELLRKQGVPLTIIASNHGAEFIEFQESFESHGNMLSMGATLGNEHKRSLWGLRNLMEAEAEYTPQDLHRLANTIYKPCLKLLDYELHDAGITIFTHAPVRFSVIAHAAKKLSVDYDDTSKEALAKTINAINQAFQLRASQGVLSSLFYALGTLESYSVAQQRNYPFTCLIWNRWPETLNATQEAQERPSTIKGYTIRYIHGHDSYDNAPEHVVNLDSELGKGSEESGEYRVWNSPETANIPAAIALPSPLFFPPAPKPSENVTQEAEQQMLAIKQRYQQKLHWEHRLWVSLFVSALLLGIGFSLGLALVLTGTLLPFGTGGLLVALGLGGCFGLGAALLGFFSLFLGLRNAAYRLDFAPAAPAIQGPIFATISPAAPLPPPRPVALPETAANILPGSEPAVSSDDEDSTSASSGEDTTKEYSSDEGPSQQETVGPGDSYCFL